MKDMRPEKLLFDCVSVKGIVRAGMFGGLLACMFLHSLALADEPAWWTQMKAACRSSGGEPASENYNDWVTGGGCVCPGSTTGSGQPTCPGSASSSGSISGYSGGGYTPQQQMILNGAQMMMPVLQQAVHNALYGNPEQDAARKAQEAAQAAAQAAEQQRQAEERARRAEATREQLLGKHRNSDAPGELSLMDITPAPDLQLMTGDQAPNSSAGNPAGGNPPPGNNPSKHSDAYNKGYDDASQCYSQNAGPRCAAVAADQQLACITDYRAGYELGDKRRLFVLQEAYQSGQIAGAKGEADNGRSDPRAAGSCRQNWIITYSRGYIRARFFRQARH